MSSNISKRSTSKESTKKFLIMVLNILYTKFTSSYSSCYVSVMLPLSRQLECHGLMAIASSWTDFNNWKIGCLILICEKCILDPSVSTSVVHKNLRERKQPRCNVSRLQSKSVCEGLKAGLQEGRSPYTLRTPLNLRNLAKTIRGILSTTHDARSPQRSGQRQG